MKTVYLSLGANIGEPYQQLKSALLNLKEHPEIGELESSSFYRTKPIGPKQPDFLNLAAKITTTLSPHALLAETQAIEAAHHRHRTTHWGPRTLDIDLLMYEEIQIQSDTLTLPHPEMEQRAFVLIPLAEIAPHLILPSGRAIQSLISHLNPTDVIKLKEPL